MWTPPAARTSASGPNSKARLLKRVFELDLEHCPNCGGQLRIVAAILESAVIEQIPTHLGLQARAPPPGPGARPHATRCVMAARRTGLR